MRRVWFLLFCLCLLAGARAQVYDGISGLIHVPTAEMAREGTARVGGFFLNGEFLPDKINYKGDKYNTTNHYLSIAPFPWIELSYVCTLMKGTKNLDEAQGVGYNQKDRHFSLKLQPLKEGKWWPAVAVGVQDPGRTVEDESGDYAYFRNYYVAASKHVESRGDEWGVHLAYRHYKSRFNAKWNGVVGGITYRPAFARNLRALVEYTGDNIHAGVDCLRWKHLLLQASLQRGKYFSGGICFQMNLF